MEIYLRAPEGRSKALTFSYDDGAQQDVRLAKLLESCQMSGTFNVNSKGLTPNGSAQSRGTMTYSQCAELSAKHEIASHTLTHPSLDHLSDEQLVYEIFTDRINLERLTGKIVRGMAYPFGAFSDGVIDTMKKCGIAYSRTVRQTLNFSLPREWLAWDPTCHHNAPELMPLADRFAKMNTDGCQMQLFYIWGHSYEFDRDGNWSVIERLTDALAGHSDIWYATNIEIYDYIHAFGELQFDLEQTQCHNPTATKLWFACKKDLYCVDAGQTVKL